MKSVVAPALTAIVLAIVGAFAWMEGKTETRLAEAHRQLATLQYSGASDASDQIVGRATLARVFVDRGLGSDTAADARQLRTTAQYWDAQYSDLTPQRDAAGSITEADPAVLIVDANASFRAGQGDADRNSAIRKLDAVVKNYTEVLKANPSAPDAAYNYEYAVRLRDSLQRARPAPSARQAAVQKTGRADEGDLPSGPTLHGHPGGPPAKTDMSQFKIVIPKRGEERKDDPQAGKGGVKVRKG
jgi:hypothetical protein